MSMYIDDTKKVDRYIDDIFRKFSKGNVLEELVRSSNFQSLEDVKRTVIHGPRFPKGEATLPPQYRERRVINVNGENVVLQVKTARIFLELTMESTIKEIEEICKKHIPYGFDINQDRSHYIRKQKTVTDKICALYLQLSEAFQVYLHQPNKMD